MLQSILPSKAMYKNRNTGAGNRMWYTWGMGAMLYSGECHQTFWGISPEIPGNVAKHSEECRQTFRGMSSHILRNVLKHSRECPQTFQRMSPNIPGNVAKHFGECHKTFWGTFFKHSSCSEWPNSTYISWYSSYISYKTYISLAYINLY